MTLHCTVYMVLFNFIHHICGRPRELYCGHACLCLSVCVCVCLSVCLSVRGRMPTLLHGPGCNLQGGRGCPLVVHYWADLQSVHGLRCYGNTMECVAEPSGNPPGPPHAARMPHTHTTHAGRLPSPAIKSTRLLRAPFHFVHTAGVL